MPDLHVLRYHHLSLSVTDLARSAEWYQRVLGFASAPVETNGFSRTRLRSPRSGLVLSLTAHGHDRDGRFDERRIGMDHFALEVDAGDDPDGLLRRFDALGVAHAPHQRSAGGVPVVTLRDPDNVQVEVFHRRGPD